MRPQTRAGRREERRFRSGSREAVSGWPSGGGGGGMAPWEVELHALGSSTENSRLPGQSCGSFLLSPSNWAQSMTVEVWL